MDGQLNPDQQQLVESMLIARPQFGDKLRDLTAVRDIVVGLDRDARVDVANDGAMSYHEGNSEAGSYIELRAEMNVLTILNTCSHPLAQHEPRKVHVAVRKVAAPADDDSCRLSRPENGRGFILTGRYFA